MQKEQSNDFLKVNGDIVSLMEAAKEVGWENIKPLSVHRIIYTASVLYSFTHEKNTNPFSEDYDFGISLRGPFSDVIQESLDFLNANDYIAEVDDEESLKLGDEPALNLEKTRNFEEKKIWIENIIYIMALYGENKIYDFVFRDPEYQDSLQRNIVTEINLDKGNKSDVSLRNLRKAFESSLGEDAGKINSKEYLNMYFKFIFSKILRGETK